MTDVVIQKGTPRAKRDVTKDKEFLVARIERLTQKEEVFSGRLKATKKELKERVKQLEALK